MPRVSRPRNASLAGRVWLTVDPYTALGKGSASFDGTRFIPTLTRLSRRTGQGGVRQCTGIGGKARYAQIPRQ